MVFSCGTIIYGLCFFLRCRSKLKMCCSSCKRGTQKQCLCRFMSELAGCISSYILHQFLWDIFSLLEFWMLFLFFSYFPHLCCLPTCFCWQQSIRTSPLLCKMEIFLLWTLKDVTQNTFSLQYLWLSAEFCPYLWCALTDGFGDGHPHGETDQITDLQPFSLSVTWAPFLYIAVYVHEIWRDLIFILFFFLPG